MMKTLFQLKQHLVGYLQTKDLGKLKDFQEIKVAQSRNIVISKRKYTLAILEETCMLDCKLVDTLIIKMLSKLHFYSTR